MGCKSIDAFRDQKNSREQRQKIRTIQRKERNAKDIKLGTTGDGLLPSALGSA